MKDRMINYYMDVARRTAQLSYAEKLKVGAVLVKNDNIVSFSWNGTPRGWDNVCEDKVWLNDEYGIYNLGDDEWIKTNYPYREIDKNGDDIGRYHYKTKSCVTHAEEALLMKIASSNESSDGAVLFCTHSCCMSCAKLIYGAKISAFYYENDYRSEDGINFLKDCGIPVYKVIRG